MSGEDLDGTVSYRHYIIKASVLVLLCCQNAGHALMSRYSQGILKESYSASEVVIVGELLKMIFSAYFCLTDKEKTDAVGSGLSKLVWLILNSRKIIVVVTLYAINNILAYYALARVEASVYSVILQLKVFTTAAMAVLLYNKKITRVQWRALILLVIGCILVVSPTFNRCECDQVGLSNRRVLSDEASYGDASAVLVSLGSSVKLSLNSVVSGLACSLSGRQLEEVEPNNTMQSTMGIAAILIMVTLSGYAGVYLENTVKDKNQIITIWERNFQLAFYSIAVLIIVMFWEHGYNNYYADYNQGGSTGLNEPYVPFKGWTINTIIILILQAGGGLLVAATLKYADAILKTMATCGAIVISTILGYFFLNGTLDIIISLGCISTILAIVNYNFE